MGIFGFFKDFFAASKVATEHVKAEANQAAVTTTITAGTTRLMGWTAINMVDPASLDEDDKITIVWQVNKASGGKGKNGRFSKDKKQGEKLNMFLGSFVPRLNMASAAIVGIAPGWVSEGMDPHGDIFGFPINGKAEFEGRKVQVKAYINALPLTAFQTIAAVASKAPAEETIQIVMHVALVNGAKRDPNHPNLAFQKGYADLHAWTGGDGTEHEDLRVHVSLVEAMVVRVGDPAWTSFRTREVVKGAAKAVNRLKRAAQAPVEQEVDWDAVVAWGQAYGESAYVKPVTEKAEVPGTGSESKMEKSVEDEIAEIEALKAKAEAEEDDGDAVINL